MDNEEYPEVPYVMFGMGMVVVGLIYMHFKR